MNKVITRSDSSVDKTLTAYPFSGNHPCPDILNGRTPEQFLKDKYQQGSIFGLDNMKEQGYYRYMGWQFNFRPFMKRYLIRQFDFWSEKWAPSRTALRLATYGRIKELVEIPEKKR